MIGASDLFEPRRARLLRWSSAAALVVAGHVCGAALATMNWQAYDTPDPADGAVAIELAPMPLSPRLDMPDLAHGPLMEEAKLTPQAAKEVKEEIEKELPRVEPSPLAPEPQVVLPTPKPVDDKKPEQDQAQEEVPTQHSETQTAAAPLTTAPPPIDAKAAPVAAAPAPGLGASVARIKASWEKSIVSHLNRYKRYPDEARVRGVKGDVRVRFILDRTGHVTSAQVVRRSGSTSLDDEALAVLQRASPLPAPPEQVTGTTFDLVLPIQFKIK
jgi:protein TonB